MDNNLILKFISKNRQYELMEFLVNCELFLLNTDHIKINPL
jgi:hypothetical protein